MYQYGYGVPVNYQIAYKWFYAAHILDNKRAQQHINDLSASKMSNIQIGAAIDEARAFLSYAIRGKKVSRVADEVVMP